LSAFFSRVLSWDESWHWNEYETNQTIFELSDNERWHLLSN